MSCTYIIIPLSDITQAMLNVCAEKSIDKLRTSTIGNAILKWEGTAPAIFSSYTKYTHSEMLVKRLEAEWNPSMESA